MKFRVLFTLIMLCAALKTSAETIRLNCENDHASSNNRIQLTIDLDEGIITKGPDTYRIIQIDDEYIFAMETAIQEGKSGSAISIDRNTGRFKWSSIDTGVRAEGIEDIKSFSVKTNTGQCRRPVI